MNTSSAIDHSLKWTWLLANPILEIETDNNQEQKCVAEDDTKPGKHENFDGTTQINELRNRNMFAGK